MLLKEIKLTFLLQLTNNTGTPNLISFLKCAIPVVCINE